MIKLILQFKRALIVFFVAVLVFGANATIADAKFFDWISGFGIKSAKDSPALSTILPYLSSYNSPAKGQDDKDKAAPVISNEGFIVANNSPSKNTKPHQEIKFSEMTVSATAYSSTPDQTDDTPFITAWNTHVRDGIVAANFLPFGTKIKIPEIYGDKIFVVEDRMNARYWHKIDVWFPDRESAKQFGLKTVKIQILES